MQRMSLVPLILLAITGTPSLVQGQSPERIAPACGPDEVQFEAHPSKDRSNPATDSDAAKLHVIQIIRTPFYMPESVTIRIGLDSKWIGATRGNSYVTSPVGPGEHHLCVQWQSTWKSRSDKVELIKLHCGSG